MLAATDVSESGGKASHPLAGLVNPQMFRKSTVNKVTSKFCESGGPEEGYKSFHCEGFITLYLSFCSIALFVFNAAVKVDGGYMKSNAALNACVPLFTKSRPSLAPLASSLRICEDEAILYKIIK
jgi:hypothetical protein